MAELNEMKGEAKEEPKAQMAATLDEDSQGDVALLGLAKLWWFKIYLLISFALAVSEPFLVAFPDTTYTAQVIVLALSSALWIFGYICVMIKIEEGGFFKRLHDAFLTEILIEVVCFAIGWSLIFRDPGMASIRCFRVFRFVWYSEFYEAKKGTFFYPVTFFAHIVLQYLEKIGAELCTTNSKGGIVVLGFFFYMAYVFGVSFWQKTGNLLLASPEGNGSQELSECDTLPHCFLIMLRLTFWDGSGFDYLKSLMDNGSNELVSLLILYMCISAMVLLNGLIGIFGGAFQAATVEEDEGEESEQTLERIENLCKQLSADVAELKNKNN